MPAKQYIPNLLLSVCMGLQFSLSASAMPLRDDDLRTAKAGLHTVRQAVESIRKQANSGSDVQHTIDELLHAENLLLGEALEDAASDSDKLQKQLVNIRSDLAYAYMKLGDR